MRCPNFGSRGTMQGTMRRAPVPYLKLRGIQVSTSSFHVRCDNAQVRRQTPRQQAAPRPDAVSPGERLASKQQELARHREELTSYEEAIQAGEQLKTDKDIQHLGQLAHFAF
ncbi:hypothetical protein PG995_006375 [Apiospora arundinis]